MPSGGSQVDIADVCWGGGLIQLVEAFPAGASLCLLVLLLLPPLAQAAQQHAFNLLLALLENVLQYDKKRRLRRGFLTFPNEDRAGCNTSMAYFLAR